jgi:outer membrane lipoprotein-sorting protein
VKPIVGIAVAAIALCAGAPCLADPPSPPAAGTPAPTLPPELVDLDRRIAAIRDLRADFEQRKHTPLLKNPLVSRGTVLVRRDRARWDTHTPRRSSLLAERDCVRIHYPDERVVEIYPVAGDLHHLAGSPLPRLSDLAEHFDIRQIDPSSLSEGSRPERPLAAELLPRAPELRDAVASVGVLFDAAIPCVARVVMTDPDGERTEIEFRSVRTDTGIPDSAMDLSVPEGTREVRPIGNRPLEPKR